MSGCCYIGTLCDAESLTGRRLLRVADIPNAIMQSVFSVAARRRDAFGSEWIVMAAPVR
jgi:hypothetical protein